MSTWGRAQDALDDLWQYDHDYGRMTDGPAKKAGITREQWQAVQEDIIAALAAVFSRSSCANCGAPLDRRSAAP